MAETESGAERSEEASAKRLGEARERGEVPRSRELGTMLLLMASTGVLWSSSDQFLGAIRRSMRSNFDVHRGLQLTDVELALVLRNAVLDVIVALAPFFVVSVLVSIAGAIALGGWTFSAEAMGFKWNRVDPIAGIGRLFSMKSLMELLKASVKFLLLLGIALGVLWHDKAILANLAVVPLDAAIATTAGLAFKAFLWVSGGTVLIAAVDVPFQLWDYAKNLRMSKQELREEAKESDGSPEVKARIRSLQQDLARRRMMEQVPKADVVVTNPEHYAVALRFDPATMSAPLLVAKGADEVAFRIREIAKSSGVTLLEAPPLARAVYHSTKLNHEIPAGLYLAVAQVLAYVFQLRARPTGGAKPKPPQDFVIPPDLQY